MLASPVSTASLIVGYINACSLPPSKPGEDRAANRRAVMLSSTLYRGGLGALTYHLSVLRYPTDTAHRAVRQSGTLAQPIASRGCLCPSFARTHRTLATLPFAVSEAGSRKRIRA